MRVGGGNGTPVAPGRRTRAACLAGMALAATAALLLRSQVPVLAIRADYDNSLYVRLATSLARGDWLGRFDDLTLAKYPGYPMFVAAMKVAGLPLKLGEQLTAVLAAAVLAGCIWVTTRRPVLTSVVFGVFVLDAGQFAAISAPVRRDGWYSSLTILVMCGSFLLVRAALGRAGPGRLLLGAAGLGLVLAAFKLCREESVWIVPALLFSWLLPVLVTVWRRRRGPGLPASARPWLAAAARFGLVAAVLAVTVAAPDHYIAERNHDRYGAAVVNDGAGAMGTALARWGDVVAGPSRRYVTLTAAQRRAVYQVSPAAAELAPFLEDPHNVWLQRSQQHACRPDRHCSDYVSWLEGFAVRDAAADAGHFRDEGEAQRYFTELASQIRQACQDHRLRCRAGIPGLPGVHDPQLRDSAVDTLHSLWLALTDQDLMRPVDNSLNPGLGWTAEAQRAAAGVVVGMPGSVPAATQAQRRYQQQRFLFAFWARVYRFALPALLLLGPVALVVGRIRGRRAPRGLGLLAGTLLAALILRAAMLGLVNATILRGAITSPGYEQVSRVLMLALGLVGLAHLVEVLRARPADLANPADPADPGSNTRVLPSQASAMTGIGCRTCP